MSFEIKYRTYQAMQSGSTLRLDILEDEYAGDIISYNSTVLSLAYIPSSDDPFETIYASQLTVGLDVTDDVDNMPDFTTLDDRKYLCKLYEDDVLIWQGWVLSDNVQFPFTTGRKIVTFNAVCGLGLLNNLDFVYSNTSDTNTRVTLLQLITNCLNQIEFPTGLNLFISCNIYASGMGDPDSSPTQPFGQAYTPLTSAQDNGVFKKSIEVLRDILFSFGCRILQARGMWHILQVNQMDLDDPYFEIVNASGTTQSGGQFSDIKNFPDDLKFIGNSQVKIFRKGYNNIISDNPIVYPENYIFNSDLKINDGTDATGWVRTESGTGTVVLGDLPTAKNSTCIMNIPNASADIAQIEAVSLPTVAQNDEIRVGWTFYGGIFANVTGYACFMLLTISNGVNTYYYDTDGDWQLAVGPITNYFAVPDEGIIDNASTSYNVTLKPAPIGGEVGFGLRLDDETGTSMTVGGFSMTVDSPFRSMLVTSRITDTNDYTLEVSFPYGAQSEQDGVFSFIGFLGDEDGLNLQTWYMYERKATQNFRSLIELMVQNYVNQYRSNTINVDAVVEGLSGTSGRSRFTFDDLDPSQINVSENKYVIGNSSVNYARNELQSTFLKVSNENQEAIITVVYDNNQDTGVTTTGRRISVTAALTKPEACAFVFSENRIYFVDNTYSIGDTVYASNSLITPFNGAMLWWLVEIVELNSSRAMRISNSGEILDIQTC